MSSTPTLNEILEIAKGTKVNLTLTRYACAMGVTILCYDTLLTFSDEVQLIWGSKWRTAKFLLYFIRILAFVSLLANSWHLAGFRMDLEAKGCEVILFGTGYAAILSFCIANWMLLLRVSALYGHNRTIFWGLTIFWFLSYIATFTTMCLTVKELHGKIYYSTLFNVCVIPQMPTVLPIVWVSPMAFEITTFLMSIYKTWRHAWQNGDLNSNPLMRVLNRDGVVYFIVIMCMRIFNLICWLIFPVSLMFVGVFILWTLVIVMINRLFLNLRSLHNPEKINWGGEVHHSTRAEGDLRRTHTPALFPSRAQSTNIFRGGTMICEEELSTIHPKRGIAFQVTRTEERASTSLDSPWPIDAVPMPDKAYTLAHFLPHDTPLEQARIQVPTTAATPLTNQAQGSVSPQAALGCDRQLPHGASSRGFIPLQNSGNWDETGPYEEGSPRQAGLGSYGP